MVYSYCCEVINLNMRIREFAAFTGVSVRTLHYYDEIGLLEPAFVDRATGYRYYDEISVLRMQEILFYRELDFSLKTLKKLLSSPDYNRTAALEEQKKLLVLKKERLERLFSAIDGAVKGETVMAAFDSSEFEKTKAEAKTRWGGTQAYRQYEEKTGGCSDRERSDAAAGMDRIMEAFAACMKNGETAGSAAAQALVRRLQSYITAHFYDCTDQILAELGQMYVSDDRFRQNIDKHGAGAAEFIRDAIEVYCGK